MTRTKRFTLRRITLGLALAAIVPASAQAKPADFWNYDPQTGKKIANTSPGLSAEQVSSLWSVSSGVSKSPDDRPFSRATNLAAAKPVDFWNYDPQTGKKIANTSPGLSAEEVPSLWSVPSGTTKGTPSVGDGGGYDLRTSVVSGFLLALVLAAGGAFFAIRHQRRARVLAA